MEKSSFFNAQMDASGEYDREYLAEDFASYFSKFISNGVFPNPSTGLQVIAADTPNMTVTLSVGYGYINGYKYENTTPLTFSIGVADGVLNRKDAIFIRYSKLGRAIKAYKIAGTPGASAVAPSVVRTEDYYDLCVAIISVNAGITAIPQSLIEDTRLNTSLCGIVTGLVEQVDTTTLYNQIQSDLSQFKTVSQAEFDAWFEDINAKLGTEPATALQQQVDALDAAKMDKATYDADGDGVVDEAEKVSNALTLKNAAGEVVATFDGSEAAILQLTAALVGALGKTEKAADSSKLAGLSPVIDNPGPSNRNSWYFPFTGTNNKDGTRKYYACIYADRATNLSMSLSGTTLTINYS